MLAERYLRNVSGACTDAVVAAWIVASRVLIVALAVGVTAYLAFRPILPAHPAGGLSAFAASWSDELRIWPSLLGHTVVVSTVASAVSLSIALPLAFVLVRTDAPGKGPLLTVLLMFAGVPLFAAAAGMLAAVGLRRWEGNAAMVGIIHGWLGVPLATLQMALGYFGIHPGHGDAAQLEAGLVKTWWHVDLPLVRSSVLSVVLLQTWFAGTDIMVSDLLSVRTFAEETYVAVQMSRAAILPAMVVVPYALVFLGLVLLMARSGRGAAVRALLDRGSGPSRVPLRARRWIVGAVTTVAVVGIGLFPIVMLVRQLDSIGSFIRWAGQLRSETADSVVLCLATATTVAVIAMGAAHALVFRPIRRASLGRATRRLFGVSILLLLSVPTPCLAVTLIEWFNRDGPLGALYDSLAMPVIGQTVRWIPLGILICIPGFARVPLAVDDAARADGCNYAGRHRHVYWPASRRFLGIAWLAVVIFTFGELTCSVLLSPPGVLPLSVRFFTLAHYGLHGQAVTICLLSILVVILPWSLLARCVLHFDS